MRMKSAPGAVFIATHFFKKILPEPEVMSFRDRF